MANDDNPEGLLVGKKFMVGKYIASGSFGKLYLGKNIQTGEEVAIKMELKDINKPQLLFEFAFFRLLKATEAQEIKGFPKIYCFGPCGPWNALVMEHLGPNLEDIHEKCGKFSLKTTILLTKQLMEIYEYFHGKRLIYRDIKPENFLFGLSGTDKYCVVHIIDMGLCKEYMDENGNHIPMVEGKSVTGTVRYMSVNNHLGREQGRRDDMEALGYMIVYFIKAELPWMGVKAGSTADKFKIIANIKRRIKTESLCADLPQEFCQYLNYVKSLEFEEEPNYKLIIQMFDNLYKKSGFKNDGVYDFDRNHCSRK